MRTCTLTYTVTLLLSSLASAADVPVFEKDIAPILRAYCAGCHNDEDLEGGLSVETFAQLNKGGDDHAAPVKPGDPAQSFLIKAIEGTAKPKMPPKDEPPVPAEELAVLKRWIAAGAPGPRTDESILRTLSVPALQPSSKPQPVSAATVSPDGKRLALARSGSVEFRDATTDEPRATITGLPGKINAVHFSADGTRIVAACGIPGLMGVAQIRDVATGALVREFKNHSDSLYDAEFSPDGALLATAGYDRVIRIWNAADGKLIRSIDVHKGAVFDLAFDPSGKILASASADETVKLWRVADGERLDTLNAPQGEQVVALFTHDGQHILSAGADRRIHMWRLVSREKPALNPLVHSRFAHEAPIVGLILSSDGKFVISSAADRTIKLWTLPDLELRHAFPPQPDITPALAAIPGTDRFVAARMDGSADKLTIVAPASTAQPAPSVALAGSDNGADASPAKISEAEPNNIPAEASSIPIPCEFKGSINTPGDRDLVRFKARAGESIVLETNAARSKSRLDSRIEILHPDGRPVEQVVLQATRDSWFTFRGKDSDTPDDFRVHNWAQMELNEYLYANGEVVKLWLYPRGPDSGFKVYPGEGKRFSQFFTTPLAHALGQPAYVVNPLPPGSQPAANGLPVFHLNYENDDDAQRRAGSDSVLHFTAPADGEYLARVTDVRGFGGASDFHYTLVIRQRHPDFKVTIGGLNPKVSPGSGRELSVKADRIDGYDGPIRVDITNLPAGFTASAPIEIEAGQISAEGAIYAEPAATNPGDDADKAVKITATATINGRNVTHDVGTLGNIEIGLPAKLLVEIIPGENQDHVKVTPGQPLELSIRPGKTISAKVRATRTDFTGRIELGNEGAGRNLPFGLYVDNIGLNGLLIVEGQTEREFFVTAAPIAQPGTRLFHLKASADGGQCSRPVIIRVLPAEGAASASR